MAEPEVLYTDVKFTRRKRESNETGSSSADTTHTPPSTEELTEDHEQVVLNRMSKVTSERMSMLVLSALLAAAVTALAVTIADNMRTKKTLEDLKKKWESQERNLTEILSERMPCSTVLPELPEVQNDPCYKCEEGWEQHGETCYYFSSNISTWNKSRDECRAKGGDLVKIDSRDEQKFLAKRLRDVMKDREDKFWIGLTDSAEQGKWLWVDGSPLDTRLSYWHDNEPDNWRGEDCVKMGVKDNGVRCWFDTSCNITKRNICEKPVVNCTA